MTMVRIVIFAAAALVFAGARFPLSVALDLADARARGVDYLAANGAIWDGVLVDVSIAGQAIGVVRAKTAPLSVLTGSPRLTVAVDGEGVRGDGVVVAEPLSGRVRLQDAVITIDVSRLEALHPRLRADEGRLRLSVALVVMDRSGCLSASGVLEADALAQLSPSTPWTGPALSGAVTCEDGRLRFTLSGEEDGASIDAIAELSAAGGADVRVEVRTQNPEFAALAALLGFEDRDDVYVFKRQTGLDFRGGA